MKALLLISFALYLSGCQTTPPQSTVADEEVYYAFKDGNNSKTAVILCHGKGKYPTWKVVEPLRQEIHSEFGYHTLSLQMPKGDVHWQEYADFFPQAHANITKAIEFLTKEKGVEQVYLLGHSMGSRMVSAYRQEAHKTEVAGMVLIGCRNNGGYPLACDTNAKEIKVPVLDMWGDADSKDSLSALERRHLQSKSYTQVPVSGADHQFNGYDYELTSTVLKWFHSQK